MFQAFQLSLEINQKEEKEVFFCQKEQAEIQPPNIFCRKR